jgi:alpha-glucosidase (family GH31 glycosyl hydrolase)
MGETNPDLCKRWQQLGAFYPFSRNHNVIGAGDQDPGVWVEKGHPEVTDAARSSLNVRYILLHYLYTLFFRAHTLGETVARPVFHEYPKDNNTYGIDQQFFWGRSILVSPLLFPVIQKKVSIFEKNFSIIKRNFF